MRTLYEEALKGIAYWVAVLNEAEQLVGKELEDQSVYLGKIPVRFAGTDGELVGHLVDEIGGIWAFRAEEEER